MRNLLRVLLLIFSLTSVQAQILNPILFSPTGHAGYQFKSSVAFTGATSSTQTNITLAFAFNDAKLATVANGGKIQNTCSHVVTVPCDLVFTNDSSCTTLTGSYTWGFDGDWDQTAGTGRGWLMIPSYTTGGVTPTVCLDNIAVTTYQGGAVGAEFNTSYKLVWHLPDGSSLNANDFSSNASNANTISATACAGKIDGASCTNGSNQVAIPSSSAIAVDVGDFTVSLWINTTTAGGFTTLFDKGIGGVRDLTLFYSGSTFAYYGVGANSNPISGSATLNDGVWHYITWTRSGIANTIYVDASLDVSFSNGATNDTGNTLSVGLNPSGGGAAYVGATDEFRLANTFRTANWIATEYANQSAPPIIGAFSAI